MPGETGLDLIRFALCEHPETATLLISALEDPGIAQVAMDFGAYGYLSKPVRRSAVLIGVMTALRRRDVEARERAARLNLEDNLRLRTSALTEALEQLEGAAAQGRVLQGETIHRWAQSAEYRDPGIGRHLKRVGHYCAVLGQKLGLHAESLELASVLHDVGKVAIPDSILLKAGPLTAGRTAGDRDARHRRLRDVARLEQRAARSGGDHRQDPPREVRRQRLSPPGCRARRSLSKAGSPPWPTSSTP